MIPNVYISCPISVPQQNLDKIIRALYKERSPKHNNNFLLQYWHRQGSYDKTMLEDCDIFIVVLPNNAFNHFISALPVGVKRELTYALQQHKLIFLSYTDKYGCVNFYQAYEDGGIIRGIAGTTDRLWNAVENLNNDKHETKSEYLNSIQDQLNSGYKSMSDILHDLVLNRTIDHMNLMKENFNCNKDRRVLLLI